MSYENVPCWIRGIPGHLKTQEICNEAVRLRPYSLHYIPDQYKTQEMCNEAVSREPYILDYVPNHFKTQEMCNESICGNPAVFFLVPDRFKIQEVCIKAVEVDPWDLYHILNHFKTQEMCNNAAQEDPSSLQYVPDSFVSCYQIDLWGDNDDYYDDYKLIKWHESYEKRRAQKAKIKEELLSIAWHPSRWWDWCVPEDEKIGIEKLWK